MEFRRVLFRSSDTSGNMPFLSRLAAARCAFRWVASIINWSGLPALAASAAKILLNTPSRRQRLKRLYIVLSGPYSAGASRQRRPFLLTKMMPLMIRRSSTGRPPCLRGKYGPLRGIRASDTQLDPKSNVLGKGVSVRVDPGGRRLIHKNPKNATKY